MHTDLYLLTPRRKALYDEHVGAKVEEDVAVGERNDHVFVTAFISSWGLLTFRDSCVAKEYHHSHS